MKKIVRCEECPAWVFSKDATGFCKRRAPQPTVMKKVNAGEEYELVWPSTLKDDGCGDGIERG